jgi:hypothetical protein
MAATVADGILRISPCKKMGITDINRRHWEHSCFLVNLTYI